MRVLSVCLLLNLLVHLDAATFKLGYLYIQSGSSWVVESFSQFKLAVAEANRAQLLGVNNNLSYVVYNSQGTSTNALAGAIALLSDPDVVGLVGTGYSSAAESAARYCSLLEKPMISPGSTSISLVNKAEYPYFLRSIASAEQEVKAIVSMITLYGWRHAALLHSGGFFSEAELFLEEALRLGVAVLVSLRLPGTDSASYYAFQMELPLVQVRESGARIVAALTRTVDTDDMLEQARSLGLLTTGYVWVGGSCTFTSALVASDGGLPGWLYLQVQSAQMTSRRVLFDAAWPNVSRRYNSSVDGAFDASSGLPFFGDNIHSPVVWDTDYAPVGDGLPDYWGSFVYDTVWLYAEALANMTARGLSAGDGSALLGQLLRSDFEGITGRVVFDPRSQDRAQHFDLMNVQVQEDGTLRSVPLGPESVVQWLGGANEVPGDGSELDATKSQLLPPPSASLYAGSSYNLTLNLLNSLHFVPPVLNTSELSVTLMSQGGSVAIPLPVPDGRSGSLVISCHFAMEGVYTVIANHRKGGQSPVHLQGSPMQLVVLRGAQAVAVVLVPEVHLGVLLGMFGTEDVGYSAITWSARGGAYQALRELNDKSDGVDDELLPNTQLRFAYRDSKCDSTSALQATLQLTQYVFQGSGVSAIIGAGCSSASETAAQVAEGSNVPIVSPSSLSPSLSNGRAYPYFVRTVCEAVCSIRKEDRRSAKRLHSRPPWSAAAHAARTPPAEQI